jgi:hypothetical protein
MRGAKVRIKFTIFESFMENSYKYSVAGHIFRIVLPEGYSKEDCLAPYSPFEIADDAGEPLFTLKVELTSSLRDTLKGSVKEIFNDEPPYFWLFEGVSRKWFFGFSYSKRHPDCILVASEDYKDSVVYVPQQYASMLIEFSLSNAMMLLYTFCTTPYDTLMVHASVIRKDDRGYMFLGKSGTGKSTHSSLWLKHIEGTELLNDDNPVVRVIDGQAYVYGSPWSGKTPCYKNEVVPLGGVVRLSQAPYNKINRLVPLQAYAALLPSCSCMRWDPAANQALHTSVEKVISTVRCWHLECLPDEDAARTCHNAVI